MTARTIALLSWTTTLLAASTVAAAEGRRLIAHWAFDTAHTGGGVVKDQAGDRDATITGPVKLRTYNGIDALLVDRDANRVTAPAGATPLPADAINGLQAIDTLSPGPILLEGTVDTLGRRYVMEEARFRLGELGATIVCPSLDGSAEGDHAVPPGAILVIAEGMTTEMSSRTRSAHAAGAPLVVLAEQDADKSFDDLAGAKCTKTDDFVSALYFAVWAAIPISAAPCGPPNNEPHTS